MSNVTSLSDRKTKKFLGDFQKQELKFDLKKLKNALNEVLKIKGFDTSLGIPQFAGISLNQIPGDPESIKGHNVRGVFWTRPDSSGNEVQRDSGGIRHSLQPRGAEEVRLLSLIHI